MSARLCSVLALAACGAPAPVILGEDGAAELVVLERDAHVRAIRAYAAGDPALLAVPRTEGVETWILAYDRPLAERGIDAARLAIAAEELPSALKWPLPAPDRAWSLAPEASSLSEGDVTPVLAGLRVERPPCAPVPPVIALPVEEPGVTTAAVPALDGVVFAMSPIREYGPRVFRASPSGELVRDLEAALSDTATSSRLRYPLGFDDEERGILLWPADVDTASSAARIDLVPVSRDGVLGAPTPTFIERGPAAFEQVAAGRFAGARTVVARDEAGQLWALDEAAKRWRRRAELGPPDPNCADDRYHRGVLTVDGPGRGLASGFGVALRPYDLARTPPLGAAYAPGTPCSSSLARAPSGLELWAHDESSVTGVLPQLAWRRADGAWEPLELPGSLGRAAALVGERIWVSGAHESLLVFDDEPGRPELPPRYCDQAQTVVTPNVLLPLASGYVFVGGYGNRAAFVGPES